ncbi:hypothetical protein JCM10207_006782 [Rhodosporidiobolus poonsookiae]
MRPPRGLRYGGLPRPSLARPPSRPSTFATLAPARPQPQLARPALHPSFFLVHLGGITAASCLIPVIAARHASSRASEEPDPPEPPVEPPVTFNYPIQHPNPPPYQLLRLSSHLRQQISRSPLDAAFTLRQLHLVNQVPQLYLPDQSRPHPPSHDLSNLTPERWVWRMPAAAALHSILRALSRPDYDKPRLFETLLPIAVTIAEHSIRFDTLMWAAVLRGRQHIFPLEWERLMAKEQNAMHGDGLAEEPASLTRLTKRARVRSGEPRVEEWTHRSGNAAERDSTSMPAVGSGNLPSFPAHLHPASSLPTRSIDQLFLMLVNKPYLSPSEVSTALALSLSLSNLRRRRSLRSLSSSITFSLRHHRPDFAARFWVDLLEEVERSGSRPALRHLHKLFRRLSSAVKPEGQRFAVAPPRRVLAAVACLARALDARWAAAVDATRQGTLETDAIGLLVRLLSTFPPAPFASDLPSGTKRKAHARIHARVYKMVREVLRRIIEDVLERDVQVGALKATVGETWATKRSGLLPLRTLDFNTVISYSLLKLQSPQLAVLLVQRMKEYGAKPTAATHNILSAITLDARDSAQPSSFFDLLAPSPQNEYTLPILLTHMTRAGEFDELDRIVFHLLPELDYLDTSSERPSSSPRIPTAQPPPAHGRSPFLYTTLLTALARAGRVGLAERVFRNARWAAELSRGEVTAADASMPAPPQRSKGWKLPPHAYTVMLQMYADEVKRGRQLERRDSALEEAEASLEPSSRFVRGWGRHALRVFLLQEQRAALEAQLGASSTSLNHAALSSSPTRRRRRAGTDLPPFLRSRAGPIAAIWELEGGSKGPELESLTVAMRSPQAQSALRVLFPGRPVPRWERAKGPDGKSEARAALRAWARASWRRGFGAPKDVARERARARGEVLRRRAFKARLKEEKTEEVEVV